MIESQTKLPAQEGGTATTWDRVRKTAGSVVAQTVTQIRAIGQSQPAEQTGEPVLFSEELEGKASVRDLAARFMQWIVTGVGDGPLVNRFALHLVVVFLAVGVVAFSQVTLPQIDFALPTPTPAPVLGSHTVTTLPTNRGADRSISTESTLFAAPVFHTIISERERDRMEVFTYTVQPNDNVFAIAQGFGLQAETVLWANPKVEKAPDHLNVGQVLTIIPVDGIYYTVQSGDTVKKLAKDYKSTVEKIVGLELNGLVEEPYPLTVGQKIIIPDGRKKVVPWQNLYPMTRVGTAPKGAATGSGKFAWPARGYLSQKYWSGHQGIDIANGTGTPIYAADAGYVVMAGRDTWGYGNQVLINHGNGYLTRYAHLHKILVTAGQSVSKNQKIGLMGNTGRSTGPHLHFEIINNNVRRNPLGFLP